MTDRSIIFSAADVAAIQRGDKTMMRRPFNPQPIMDIVPATNMESDGPIYKIPNWLMQQHYWRPRYQVGDRLWVKERWQLHGWDFSNDVTIRYADGTTMCHEMPEFKAGTIYTNETWDDWLIEQIDRLMEKYGERPADNEFGCEIAIPDDMPYRSPIFVPKWATRLWLEVTGVRAERLQDIMGTSDVQAEGYEWLNTEHGFVQAWDALNAKRGFPWMSNPWIWVYEFKVADDDHQTAYRRPHLSPVQRPHAVADPPSTPSDWTACRSANTSAGTVTGCIFRSWRRNGNERR